MVVVQRQCVLLNLLNFRWPLFGCGRELRFDCTIKAVYKDHPWGLQRVAVAQKGDGRCSEDEFRYEVNFVLGKLKKLTRGFRTVLIDRCSLAQV